MSLPTLKKLRRGQMLIGLLIAIAIFSILSSAIFTLVRGSFVLTSFNRARIGARHIAQERMELIRNLPYDEIGTVGGIPDGPLNQEETLQRNGLSYLVETDIVYVDDPFDETAPDDLLPTDYKRARIEVSWEGVGRSRKNPVIFVTDIAPKGVETTEGGGTLSILVFNAQGEPVSQADVTIVANDPDPPVNLSLQTGSNGRLILPGAPVCTSCYQITVTKEGYSSERTYSTNEIANPNKSHQTILEGELTEISFAIDLVSTVVITTVNDRDSGFTPSASVDFQMRGSKTLGTDTSGDPVYKFDQAFTTDSGGNLTINDVEWDGYDISLPTGTSWDISGTNPLLPLTVNPDTNISFSMALTPISSHSLLVAFVDTSEQPIASVSANLSDGTGYDEEKFSGASGDPDFGQAFFESLSETTYALTATASGFLDFSGNLPVSGWTYETIILTPE